MDPDDLPVDMQGLLALRGSERTFPAFYRTLPAGGPAVRWAVTHTGSPIHSTTTSLAHARAVAEQFNEFLRQKGAFGLGSVAVLPLSPAAEPSVLIRPRYRREGNGWGKPVDARWDTPAWPVEVTKWMAALDRNWDPITMARLRRDGRSFAVEITLKVIQWPTLDAEARAAGLTISKLIPPRGHTRWVLTVSRADDPLSPFALTRALHYVDRDGVTSWARPEENEEGLLVAQGSAPASWVPRAPVLDIEGVEVRFERLLVGDDAETVPTAVISPPLAPRKAPQSAAAGSSRPQRKRRRSDEERADPVLLSGPPAPPSHEFPPLQPPTPAGPASRPTSDPPGQAAAAFAAAEGC